MKNRYLRADAIYEMLRDSYLQSFPEELNVKLIDRVYIKEMLYDYLTKKALPINIKVMDYRVSGDVENLSDAPAGSVNALIYKLKKEDVTPKDIDLIIDDIIYFRLWLKSEGYISSKDIATEKLLINKNWFA